MAAVGSFPSLPLARGVMARGRSSSTRSLTGTEQTYSGFSRFYRVDSHLPICRQIPTVPSSSMGDFDSDDSPALIPRAIAPNSHESHIHPGICSKVLTGHHSSGLPFVPSREVGVIADPHRGRLNQYSRKERSKHWDLSIVKGRL
jgi:hypothetical protein